MPSVPSSQSEERSQNTNCKAENSPVEYVEKESSEEILELEEKESDPPSATLPSNQSPTEEIRSETDNRQVEYSEEVAGDITEIGTEDISSSSLHRSPPVLEVDPRLTAQDKVKDIRDVFSDSDSDDE